MMVMAVLHPQIKFVLAGLDPATHAAPLPLAVPIRVATTVSPRQTLRLRNPVDGRVKPGQDEAFLFDDTFPLRKNS